MRKFLKTILEIYRKVWGIMRIRNKERKRECFQGMNETEKIGIWSVVECKGKLNER